MRDLRWLPVSGTSVLVGLAMTVLAVPVRAQQAAGQWPFRDISQVPRFSTADLARLRWLEGAWAGTSPGEKPIFETYKFLNDSTIEVTYYADAELTRATGGGKIYLNAGRIYRTSGPGRWAATALDEREAKFRPDGNSALGDLVWTFAPPGWTA